MPIASFRRDFNWQRGYEAGGKRQDTTKLSAFSVRAGIALRRKLTNVIGINLAEFSYLRTNIGTPTSTGVVLFSGPNNWTAGAGITLSLAAPKPASPTQ